MKLNLKVKLELIEKVYVVFENERRSDADGLSADWYTEYFKEATKPIKGSSS